MIKYKAKIKGIEVVTVNESYTSGTSYLDDEMPVKENYNKDRRISRGCFVSNEGRKLNADINGSYQIMKKYIGYNYSVIPTKLSVVRIDGIRVGKNKESKAMIA